MTSLFALWVSDNGFKHLEIPGLPGTLQSLSWILGRKYSLLKLASLKNMLVCHHPGLLFQVQPAS